MKIAWHRGACRGVDYALMPQGRLRGCCVSPEGEGVLDLAEAVLAT
jgi:hypothetical protein